MESEIVGAAASAGEFSMWALFLRADLVVKAVMISLLLASVWSWAIIFEKMALMARLRRKARGFEDEFWSGEPVDGLYEDVKEKPDHPMARVFVSGMREWRRGHVDGKPTPGLKERVEQSMSSTFAREMERLDRSLGFLASCGAVAPFVGLFGTVWGIMNSFRAIAASQNTSLVVVAPGIAEALFATALGLLAAIPAVIFYNKITGDIGRYAGRVEAFADDFIALVSRHSDRRPS
ncbi:protein TolQ [Futiania mangrovi]|nr:protein TolQ [Futiania mangrovii]